MINHYSIQLPKFSAMALTLFYMGFWTYVITWGGSKQSPLLKSIKTIKTWLKCMFWQKQIIFAPNLCIRRLFSTIFDPKKSPMRKSFLRVQKGPPFGFCMKKKVDVKFFEIFKKKTQTGLPRTIQIQKGTKSSKISQFRESPEDQCTIIKWVGSF